MANYKVKPRFKKDDPETKRIASMGGKAKKGTGTASLKRALKEMYLDGTLNVYDLAKASHGHAIDGNSPYAKLIANLLGDEVNKLELTGKDGQPFVNKIEVEFVKPKTKTTRKAK